MTNDVNRNALAAALKLSGGRVVKVSSQTEVVINLGAQNGLRQGQEVLIYAIGEELFDPETKESLGQLELVKGRGRVTHLQPRLATVENTETYKREQFGMFGRGAELATAPFRNPSVGDLVRIL